MTVQVTNTQRDVAVDTARIARLARSAVRHLRIRTPGILAVTFLAPGPMRILNQRFCRHDRPTDVLSFRYDGAARSLPPGARETQVVGEILIAPRLAQDYAMRHRISYAEELGRYVMHGLLHWLGYDDETLAQQRAMRSMEDQLLTQCVRSPRRMRENAKTSRVV